VATGAPGSVSISVQRTARPLSGFLPELEGGETEGRLRQNLLPGAATSLTDLETEVPSPWEGLHGLELAPLPSGQIPTSLAADPFSSHFEVDSFRQCFKFVASKPVPTLQR